MTLVQVSINLCSCCLYCGKYLYFTSCALKIYVDYIIFVTGSWTWVIAHTNLHEYVHLKFSSGQKLFCELVMLSFPVLQRQLWQF